MKWGVRRFQNKDGTLTSAGKKRKEDKPKASSMSDEELMSGVKRLTLEKQYEKMSKEKAKASKLETAKKVVDTASNLANQAKNMNRESLKSTPKQKLDLSSMTDQELRDRINRFNLERQYNDIFAEKETVSKGRAFVTSAIEVGGGLLAVGSSALGIALAIKELKK
jgi:glycosylphosphatidylinositol transamidase (GPIT) subunit GPI8